MKPSIQVNKDRKYYLLNQSERLDVVLHGTADELSKALDGAVNEKTIEKAIKQEKKFSYGKARNCIIVEDFDYNDSLKELAEETKPESKLKPISIKYVPPEVGTNERWTVFKVDGHNTWYVSNQGRTKRKQISNDEERFLNVNLNKQGDLIAIVGRSREKVKDLVAKAFMKDEYKMHDNPIVEIIDGNPYNCAVDNLKIVG